MTAAARPGPRLYIHGARVHHGLVGCLLCMIGVLLAVHDRRDWPWRIRDGR